MTMDTGGRPPANLTIVTASSTGGGSGSGGGGGGGGYDPFSIFTNPPADETDEEREQRLERERWERSRHLEIEEMLRVDSLQWKSRFQNTVRVLLLGQSESGKSTILKNFRLAYAPRAFRAERSNWIRIVYLNILRAINTISSAISAELAHPTASILHLLPPSPPMSDEDDEDHRIGYRRAGGTDDQDNDLGGLAEDEDDSDMAGPPSPERHRPHQQTPSTTTTTALSQIHLHLSESLLPLQQLERSLQAQLTVPSDALNVWSNTSPSSPSSPTSPTSSSSPRRQQEFFVRAGSNWKTSWNLRRSNNPAASSSATSSRGSEDEEREIARWNRDMIDTMSACKEDMKTLWGMREVREMLERRKVRLEDSAYYYLNDLDRIVSRSYEPSDEDVVRARLRTVGVNEYYIKHERDDSHHLIGKDLGREWLLYDVGGTRTQRHSWVPFFEHMHAIIFLAPLDCFNERLPEDRSVYRLADSIEYYKQVVKSTLLAKAAIILFLNKMDLLRKKLKRGVKVKVYVSSFGKRPNEAEAVYKYFDHKFKDIAKRFSPTVRTWYSFPTSAVDIHQTQTTLVVVRDGILRSSLEHADLL